MNISIDDEKVILNTDCWYYIIDALYLQDISSYFLENGVTHDEQLIRKEIFPYCTPFTKFKMDTPFFDVRYLKRVPNNSMSVGENFFSTDTGLLVIIETSVFIDVAASNFSFDDLVEGDPIDYQYWQKIETKYREGQIALLMATGKSNPDFDGSGRFEVVLSGSEN